jgi:hypothetical protein
MTVTHRAVDDKIRTGKKVEFGAGFRDSGLGIRDMGHGNRELDFLAPKP